MCMMNKEATLRTASHFIIDKAHINWLGSIHGAELQGFPGVFREANAGGKVIGGAHRYYSHG